MTRGRRHSNTLRSFIGNRDEWNPVEMRLPPLLDLKQLGQAASANVHVTTKPRTKLNYNVIHNNGRHRLNRNFQNRYELYLFHISHLASWNAYESSTFE